MVECKCVQWILLTNETQNIFLSEVHKNTKNSGRNFYSYYFVQFQEWISSIHLIESCISLNCYLPKQIAKILLFYNTRKKRNSYCSFAICSSRYRLPLNNEASSNQEKKQFKRENHSKHELLSSTRSGAVFLYTHLIKLLVWIDRREKHSKEKNINE